MFFCFRYCIWNKLQNICTCGVNYRLITDKQPISGAPRCSVFPEICSKFSVMLQHISGNAKRMDVGGWVWSIFRYLFGVTVQNSPDGSSGLKSSWISVWLFEQNDDSDEKQFYDFFFLSWSHSWNFRSSIVMRKLFLKLPSLFLSVIYYVTSGLFFLPISITVTVL